MAANSFEIENVFRFSAPTTTHIHTRQIMAIFKLCIYNSSKGKQRKLRSSKCGMESIEARTVPEMNDIVTGGRRKYHTMYYYIRALIQIENQFSSYFQFYSLFVSVHFFVASSFSSK